MPNWTSNQLIIEGDNDRIKECCEFIKSEDIVPMPDIIKNTGSGCNTIEGKQVNKWYQDDSIENFEERQKTARLFTPEEEAELAKIGYSNWYDWCSAKWGTKWNASETSIEYEGDGCIHILFQTAWCAPEPIFAALQKKFPDLAFQLNYRLEDDPEYPHSL